MKCHQCPNQAMFLAGPEGSRIPLCLGCNLKLVQMTTLQNDMLEREINYLTDLMGAVVGLPGIGPRYPERKVVSMGAVTLNNIKIDRSTIGVLNTGSIQTVDTAVTALQQSGDKELATAILRLSEAVLKNTAITGETKRQIVDILSVVAAEATAPPEQRRAAVIRPLLQEIATLLGGVAALAELWQQVAPVLQSAF